MEDGVIDELVLVCTFLGTNETVKDESGAERTSFVRGKDCLEWLNDLRRVIQRDNDILRTIGNKIGNWKVVEQKLLPLLLEYRDDRRLVLTLCKIFVSVTMPMHQAAVTALSKAVTRSAAKEDPTLAAELVERQKAAAEQVKHLFDYKKAFARREVMQVLVSVLEAPLSHEGTSRTEDDALIIELILTLMRNLLAIGAGRPGSLPVPDRLLSATHFDLVLSMDQEFFLDVLGVLSQNINARENRALNLLLMEIYHHLRRGTDPEALARAPPAAPAAPAPPATPAPAAPAAPSASPAVPKRAKALRGGPSGLLQALRSNQSRRRLSAFGGTRKRHNHFGGAYSRMRADAPESVVLDASEGAARRQPARRNRRRNAPFVAAHGVDAQDATHTLGSESESARRASEALRRHFSALMDGSYGALVGSLKNEFRRDSSRLQDADRAVFFGLVRFLLAFQLERAAALPEGADAPGGLGDLVERLAAAAQGAPPAGEAAESAFDAAMRCVLPSLDVFSFTLVIQSCERSLAEKRPAELLAAAKCYAAMVHALRLLGRCRAPAPRAVQLGMLFRLHYAAEPADRAAFLLRQWQPGRMPLAYLSALIDLVHHSVAALDAASARAALEIGPPGGDLEAAVGDKALLLRTKAARDFSVDRDFLPKAATNHTVGAYLAVYARANEVPPRIAERAAAFLGRLRVAPLGGGGATLRAMVLRVPMLAAAEKVLNGSDAQQLAQRPLCAALANGIAADVLELSRGDGGNDALFVDMLFPHPFPMSYAFALEHRYASPEDLQDAMGLRAAPPAPPEEPPEAPAAAEGAAEDSDSDYGVEFGDEGAMLPVARKRADAKKVRRRKKRRKERRRSAAEEPEQPGEPGEPEEGPRAPWSAEEDEALLRVWELYKDAPSRLSIIQLEDAIYANRRSTREIAARLRTLGAYGASAQDPTAGAEAAAAPPAGSSAQDPGSDSEEDAVFAEETARGSSAQAPGSDSEEDAVFAEETPRAALESDGESDGGDENAGGANAAPRAPPSKRRLILDDDESDAEGAAA